MRCGGWRVWTRSLTRPVSLTVRRSTGDLAGAPGLFPVDADTSPCGSEDGTPDPVRVCVCSSVLVGSGGPASWARFGAPDLLLWPLCLSALLGPLQAGVVPFFGSLVPSPHPHPPFFFFPCVPFPARPPCLFPSLVPGPGCLGPWRFVFLSSPPPWLRLVFFLFPPFFLLRLAPPLSLAFSGFRPQVPWAVALCAVCFVGLPLLGSPCAVASFVVPACPWLLRGGCCPPPFCVS